VRAVRGRLSGIQRSSTLVVGTCPRRALLPAAFPLFFFPPPAASPRRGRKHDAAAAAVARRGSRDQRGRFSLLFFFSPRKRRKVVGQFLRRGVAVGGFCPSLEDDSLPIVPSPPFFPSLFPPLLRSSCRRRRRKPERASSVS